MDAISPAFDTMGKAVATLAAALGFVTLAFTLVTGVLAFGFGFVVTGVLTTFSVFFFVSLIPTLPKLN